MEPSKSIRPPILLALSLIIGASASVAISGSFPVAIIVLVFVAASLAAIFALRFRPWAFAAVCCATVLTGWALGSLAAYRAGDVRLPADALSSGASLMCEARAVSDVARRDETAYLDVDLSACRLAGAERMEAARGRVRLYSSADMPEVDEGAIVRFKARIRPPREFRNPGGFSWSRHLAARGIGAVGSLAGPRWLMRMDQHEDEPRGISVLARLERHLDEELRQVHGDGAGIMRALVLGDRDAVSRAVNRDFQRTGIAHLLAISGLHVGYLAFMVYLIAAAIIGRWAWLMVRIPVQRCAALATIPLMWGFITLVGAPVSAVRAGIMVSVYLVGVVGGLRQDLLSTLAIAALIIVALNPLAVTEVSFQLSFVSVLAIIVLVPRMLAMVDARFEVGTTRMRRALHRVVQLMVVTIAATIGSAPLVAHHFHLVTPVGLVMNMVAVPWTGVVLMPLMVAAIFASFIVPDWRLPWLLAGKAADVLAACARWGAASADSLNIAVAPGMIEVFLAYAVIAVVVFWRRLAFRRVMLMALCALIVADIAWWHVRPLLTDTLEVTFFDVGQGDAALIRFPHGRTMLIDGGGTPRGSFDVGEHVVVPALLAMGVRDVDWLVTSHPHHDHFRGIAAVAEEFHPAVVWTNGKEPPEAERELWIDVERRIKAAGTHMEALEANALPQDIGGAHIELLHPAPGDVFNNPNDESLVLKVTYGDVSFLFTGDLSTHGEQAMLKRGVAADAMVLKVGHHGSSTSTTAGFLDVAKPRIAVISLGRYNPYGMPDRKVLGRLEHGGARIYRTDLSGAVTIRTDGHDLNVDTFVK